MNVSERYVVPSAPGKTKEGIGVPGRMPFSCLGMVSTPSLVTVTHAVLRAADTALYDPH